MQKSEGQTDFTGCQSPEPRRSASNICLTSATLSFADTLARLPNRLVHRGVLSVPSFHYLILCHGFSPHRFQQIRLSTARPKTILYRLSCISFLAVICVIFFRLIYPRQNDRHPSYGRFCQPQKKFDDCKTFAIQTGEEQVNETSKSHHFAYIYCLLSSCQLIILSRSTAS